MVSFVGPTFLKAREEFPDYLNGIDIILSDGIAIVTALRLLGRGPIDRISFDSSSLAPAVFQSAALNQASIVLVGGREGVSRLAAERLRKTFPGIRIVATLNGYGRWAAMIAEIVDHNPQIVICGMGAPSQEMFLRRLAIAGWKGLGFTCGGYFDQLADSFIYYPQWMNNLHLRWLYRLLDDPKRMARRYLFDYQPFLWAVCREMAFSSLLRSSFIRWIQLSDWHRRMGKY